MDEATAVGRENLLPADQQGVSAGGGNGATHRPLGEILLATTGLRPAQLAEALERQRLLAAKQRYYLLGRILAGLGYVTVEQVEASLAIQQTAGSASGVAAVPGAGQNGPRPAGTAGPSWQVATHSGPVRPISALRSLDNLHEKILAGELGSVLPVPLGFDPLDETLAGGLRPGELLLIGGSQGVGKTTLAFQIARNIAASGEANCLYVCYEHDEENLTQRLIAMETVDLHWQDFRLGVTARELARQIAAARQRGQAGLYDLLQGDPRTSSALQRLRRYGDRLFLLNGSAGRATLGALHALVEAQRVRSDERLVLFVDYLQKVPVLPEPPAEDERVTKVAQGLKELALAHEIPVVAIVAADREGLKAKRMRAHHFWGGSALAYEADVILMLAEKYDAVARVHLEYSPQKAEVFRDWVACSVEKNRAGRNTVDMEFEKRFSFCCLNPNGKFVVEKLVDERMYTQ